MSVDRWEWIEKMCIYLVHCVLVCVCERERERFSFKKEGNPAVCDNMDEPGGHFAERNTPDTDRQIVHDLTYMWNLKKKKKCSSQKSGGNQRLGGGGE